MTELLCDILEIKTIGEHEYFVVYSSDDDKRYTIPSYQLLKYQVEVGQRHYFKKELNPKSEQFFLNYFRREIFNGHKYYESGKIYEFKIIDFDNKINRKGQNIVTINVIDINENIISVLALKWQKKDFWDHKTLSCEVERIQNSGIPTLINKDFRHPFYNIDQEYDFDVIGTRIKETNKGNCDIFELKGADECIHEVKMLPGQKINNIKLTKITCKIVNISYRLTLHQANIKDPFFVTFDKIEENHELEKKYFTQMLLTKDKSDKDISKLIEQYNSKSAFWVFTFTNRILSKLFRETIKRKDFKEAKEINKLIFTFENWIIKKGIITSFTDNEVRDNTVLKAKSTLETAKIYDLVLTRLISSPFDILNDDLFFKENKNLFEKFYHVINFTEIEIIDVDQFLKRLLEILNYLNEHLDSDIHYLNKLLNYISFSKKAFISEKENENFSLSSNKNHSFNFSISENKYLKWTYGEICIAQKLSMLEHSNILSGQLLKLFTKSTPKVDKKEYLLLHAYQYFENYHNSELAMPFYYDKTILLNYDLLENNFYKKNNNCDQWSSLEAMVNSGDNFNVRLTRKSTTGYEVIYKELKGFLPFHHIQDKNLKTHPFKDADFTIEAKCLSISRTFNFFIVKQLENTPTILNNSRELKSLIGGIYDAVVHRVEFYGLFINTSIGQGLLRKSEIFDFDWASHNIGKYFESGQKIRVVLKNVTEDNKLEFNFYSIKNGDLIYYNNYVDRILSFNVEEFFEIEKENLLDINLEKAQIEKAFCLEQYAVLQFDISQKLQNFQIAKQFYTNANHYRSYLINIYTSYFEILLKIKKTLESNSLKNIDVIKRDAKEIKNKINRKTIESFPDSDRLLFFLEIISLFNEKEDSTQELLFDIIKKYNSETNQKELRTIAKITLANNLLISESEEDSDFILKNLRFIYDYLSNGILSLEESIEDKNARELKEEILYWQERIKEDESETLEFKSSFFTPILDDKTSERLDFLNKLQKKNDKTLNEISGINGDLAPKKLIHSALKTLVAFANSAGGTLLIGVDNNKNILGLENEYVSANQKLQYQNRDGFGLYFDDRIRTYIGDSFSSLMNRKFLRLPEGDILIVKVEPSINEVFLLKNEECKGCEQLYIRNLSSSKELTGSELAKFVKNRPSAILGMSK